jgi:hypothetical protein
MITDTPARQTRAPMRRRPNVEQERAVGVATMVEVGQLIKSGPCGGQLLTQLVELAERGVGVSEAVIQQRSQPMFDRAAGVGLPHREQVSDRRQ